MPVVTSSVITAEPVNPLSMLLYALSLEPLINAINKNNYIKGIKIPNLLDEIKSIQHADDTSVIIENYHN